MNDLPDIQQGTVILGKYEVIKLLGNGQFGSVFLVLNRNLGLHSALKIVRVIDPERHLAVVGRRRLAYVAMTTW